MAYVCLRHWRPTLGEYSQAWLCQQVVAIIDRDDPPTPTSQTIRATGVLLLPRGLLPFPSCCGLPTFRIN